MSLLNPNLQAFLAIQSSGTVIAAAKRLGLTQTGVTQRIRSLEQQLKVSLFTRSRKGMTLTPAGEALHRYCRDMLESEGRIFSELKGAGRSNEIDIRIAGPTSFISARAVPNCTMLYQRWPKLNLHFLIDDSADRSELLKTGRADIVVLYPHQVALEFDSKQIKPDEYILVGHPSWNDHDLQHILNNERLFAFHPGDNTSLQYLKEFDLLKHLKRPRLFVNENLALQELLIAGAGFGILLKEIAEPLLKDKQLIALNNNKAMKDPLALAWYPRREMPAYFRDVLKAMR